MRVLVWYSESHDRNSASVSRYSPFLPGRPKVLWTDEINRDTK
jgi:hypothetical protein